jgi:hypothetical protein
MTVLTYSKQDVDLVSRWFAARDAEKKNARTDHGASPNVPASLMLEIARRIWRKRCRG